MAGIRGDFGGNVDFAYGQRQMIGRQADMAGGIERGLAGIGKFTGDAAKLRSGIRDLKNELKELDNQHTSAIFAGNVKEVARLEKEMKKASKSAGELKNQLSGMPLAAMEKGLDSLTKGVLKFNTSLLGMGLDFVIDSIKRVYELQERWTKAIGGFNMSMGGMTKGLAGATKAAVGFSSTLRGLTGGDIDLQFFADLTMAMGSTVQNAEKFGKAGLVMSRGFNLGAQGAGQLLKVLNNIGDTTGDVDKFMGADLVKSANEAGVPVNMLAKDIQESSTYMARFGKESQKSFVQGAAWARKFSISMKDVQNSVQGLDMFDEAAKTASRLNTVFGTMLNSMDLMMEDDPAKRIEMLRQSFLQLGKTSETMSAKEIRLASETMHLTEDQTRSLLSRKNAGESYADFQKKATATEKEEADGKRNMEKQLRATAQTMYNFGVAFDKVTMAIAKAIKPLLVVLGLAKEGDKQFTGFGSVMEGITKTVVEFFEQLAGNDKWKSFMKELANDMLRAGHALKEFIMSGRAADMVGELAEAMKKFYTWVRDLGISAVKYLTPLAEIFLKVAKNVDKLVYAWVAFKGVGAAGKLIGNLAQSQGGGIGSFFGKGGGGSRAIGGMQAGLASGAILGGTGAMAGGALGGLIGPLGGIIGSIVGKSIEKLWTRYDDRTHNEQRDRDLGAIGQNSSRQVRAAADMDLLSIKGKQVAERRQKADELIADLQKNRHPLEAAEVDMLRERMKELQGFGKHTALAAQALQDLKPGADLSAKELMALQEASDSLAKKTADLQGEEDKLLQIDLKKSGLASDKLQLDAAQAQGKSLESQLSSSQQSGDALHKMQNDLGELPWSTKHTAKWQELQTKILQERANQEKISDNIQKLQLTASNKQRDIAEKQLMLAQKDAVRQELIATGVIGKDEKDISGFMNRWAGTHENDIRRITGIEAGEEGNRQYSNLVKGFASGGIVRSPTRAIIGESGPEAVIPLQALARGRMRQPGAMSDGARNIIGSGGSGGGQVITVATDVIMDSQKVGRALVTAHVTGRN